MASKRRNSSDDDSFGGKKRKTRIVFLGSDSSDSDNESQSNPTSQQQRTNLSSQTSSQLSNQSASLLPSFNAGETPGKKNHFDSDTEEEEEGAVKKNSPKQQKQNNNGHSYNHSKKKKEFHDDNADDNYDAFGDSSSDDEAVNERQMLMRLNPMKKEKILQFFQTATYDELCHLQKCSAKKAQAITDCRPFTSYTDLIKKLDNNATKLNLFLVNSCQILLKERKVLIDLMQKCSKTSSDIRSEFEDGGKMKKIVEKQPYVLNKKFKLKPYQMVGLNWLALLHRQKVSGVLADEMGLGKTIQTISFLAHLYEKGITDGPHLIVVPSSTLDNWQREFETWCEELDVMVYKGSQAERKFMRHRYYEGKIEANIILSSYNTVTSKPEDRSFFKKVKSYYAVFDEGHMLKNLNSQRYQHLMRINAKYRLLLTGTPLQNNLLELMSLLNFVMPSMFDQSTSTLVKMFASKSDSESDFSKRRIQHARSIMEPFVLRRLKSVVLREIPNKNSIVELIQLTKKQQALYTEVQNLFKSKNDGVKLPDSELKNCYMELRKVANHPLLRRNSFSNDKLWQMAGLLKKSSEFQLSEVRLMYEDMEVMNDFELHRFCLNHPCVNHFKLKDEDILNSGKFERLDELIPQYVEKGKKIVLFSQFTLMLDIIELYLNIRKFSFLRLDGQTPVEERLSLIDQFTNNADISLFILSTKAGGLGINLTCASTVILHDIDFNPYNDKQAEDRCHRMGQEETVDVIRMLGKNTIEEKMHRCALDKLQLEQDMTTKTDEEEVGILELIKSNVLSNGEE